MSLIALAASSSIVAAVGSLDVAGGSSASGRNPVGPSVAGMPATLNGSSNTDTALPCSVVEHAVPRSTENVAKLRRRADAASPTDPWTVSWTPPFGGHSAAWAAAHRNSAVRIVNRAVGRADRAGIAR